MANCVPITACNKKLGQSIIEYIYIKFSDWKTNRCTSANTIKQMYSNH